MLCHEGDGVSHRAVGTLTLPQKTAATVTRIASSHHVLGIEHLLSKLLYRDSAILLAAWRQHREVEGRN